MRVGILGGTFNPPHLGHLVCAQEAHAQLRLDVVLFVPAGMPPHKALEDDPGAAHRLELVRLATAGDPRLRVSTVELERPGPSYTVDTLRGLNDRDPGDELTLIVGGDMALTLPGWREPAEILALARLAVAERAGCTREEIVRRLDPLGDEPPAFLDMPRIDMSSSGIRARVAAGRPIGYLVPAAVAEHIRAHGLYRRAVRAA